MHPLPCVIGQNFYAIIFSGLVAFIWEFNFPIENYSKHFSFIFHMGWKNILGVVWLGVASGLGSALCLFYLLGEIGKKKK